MLAVQAFSATQSGTFTNIYNNILPLSWAQAANAPAAPSIPSPIQPPLENLPISPSPNGPSEGENSTNRLETSQGTSYLDYTNIKFGLKLKYPSTVTVTEEELASNSEPSS